MKSFPGKVWIVLTKDSEVGWCGVVTDKRVAADKIANEEPGEALVFKVELHPTMLVQP